MKTLRLIGMAPLVLLAATSFGQSGDDKAVPRASGGSSATAAGSRPSSSSSGGTAAQSSDSGRRGGAAATSGRGNSSRSEQAAQRRPRPGTGTGDRSRYGNNGGNYIGGGYIRPGNSNYYYNPYYYSGAYSRYSPYGYGYGYYDYGYAYGDYYGYYAPAYGGSYRYRSGNIAQLRTLVEPSKARVYVDGYYAGIVDDFDGLFQRLNVSPGRHDITFKLEGFQSHTFSVYASRDRTLKLRWDMNRGDGETRDSLAEEREDDPRLGRDDERDSNRYSDRDSDREAEHYSRDRSREVDSDSPPDARRAPAPDRGELILDIQPLDASVYVDGEFYGKASQVTSLELPAGRHRVEVVRPGYRTEETEVDVDGEARRVTVKLQRR